jgi:O-antigen biosynthesis protein WbqP
MKRLFDFFAATLMLLIALLPMLIIAVIIKKTSAGGAIFAQQRVGLNEREFKCLKFRTMASGTPDVASHQASANWITPVGSVLRKYKLDELPQLLNVIKGEMSLVGPRPCLPNQIELISDRRKNDVFSIRPGITGPAQVAGIDMSDPVKLAIIDGHYVRRNSLIGDFRILLGTISGNGAGDAVKDKPTDKTA